MFVVRYFEFTGNLCGLTLSGLSMLYWNDYAVAAYDLLRVVIPRILH